MDKITQLKNSLEKLLIVDRVEGWEKMPKKEQNFWYKIGNDFEDLKSNLLVAIDLFEDEAIEKGKMVKYAKRYAKACEKAVSKFSDIITEINKN